MAFESIFFARDGDGLTLHSFGTMAYGGSGKVVQHPALFDSWRPMKLIQWENMRLSSRKILF
jgi:hypothetical protein